MDKAPDAFRTISEVADELDVPQHVLRFWETRFGQIKPMKRGGGRRYYRPDDVDLLRGIRHLLYGEGYTIRGVQRLLKDNGAKFVQGVWVAENAQGAAPASVPNALSNTGENGVATDTVDASDDDAADDTDDSAASDVAPARQEPIFAAPTREARVTLTRANPISVAPPATAEPAPPAAKPSLSAEDRRKLDAALFELGECRRLLDLALKE